MNLKELKVLENLENTSVNFEVVCEALYLKIANFKKNVDKLLKLAKRTENYIYYELNDIERCLKEVAFINLYDSITIDEKELEKIILGGGRRW